MTGGRRARLAALLSAVALSIGAALVALAPPAAAEYIGSIEVDVTVNPDTSFRVVETIVYDFEYDYRHGIFRDIPVYDETGTGQRRNYDVTVNSVTVDGEPAQVEESFNGPFLNLRIGDPYITITGPHTYVIDYTVANGLRVITPDDVADPAMPDNVTAGDVEMYWDLVGSGWPVPVRSAVASVSGPGEVLSAICYSGPQGGSARCPAAASGDIATYGPVSLNSGEPLTGVTVYPASSFTSVPVENVTQGLPSNPLLAIGIGLIPAIALIAGPAAYAGSRRKRDAGVELPGAPPQYSAPDGLTAAELSAAWKGNDASQRSRMLVATLVDLAGRRWIDLANVDGQLNVTWRGSGRDPLRPWEESLVGVILQGQPSATLGGYNAGLTALWASTTLALTSESETQGRRNPTGDRPDQRWWWLAIIWLFATGAAVLMFFLGQGFLGAGLLTISFGALIGFITARIITPRQETLQSAQFQAKVRGLDVVLSTDAAAARREFAQRMGLPPEAIFATLLPYAIVLGAEQSWIGAFPDLTPDQLSHYGFTYLGIASMTSLVSSGTTSVSSAMTAPSSGSGGGGFSGGGGGGGGGGSW